MVKNIGLIIRCGLNYKNGKRKMVSGADNQLCNGNEIE
jgi:hypothetical protein